MGIAVIVVLLCLGAIFLQDLKYRRIHIVFPVIIFMISFFIINKRNLEIVIFNLVFFLMTIGLLTLYMSLKNKKFLNPFQNYFGLGDLFFYMAITPFFVIKNYIIFFIFSMIFAIVLQLGFKKRIGKESIPLAGFSSLLLIFVILVDLLLNFDKATILR